MNKFTISEIIPEDLPGKALDAWGLSSQLDMIQEECLELAFAISKLRRAHTPEQIELAENNMIDEIADVEFMLAQAKSIFPIEKIKGRLIFKINRLQQKLPKS